MTRWWRGLLALGLGLALVGAGVQAWRVARARLGRSAPITTKDWLAAIGYVEEVTDEADASHRGVVLHDAARTWPGVNIYCSVEGRRVHFVDMDGRELHTLVLPERGDGADCMVEPYRDGTFLALSWPTLTLLDFDSRVLWTSREGQNHDFAVDAEGRIWTLLQQEAVLQERGYSLPIVDHFLARLSPDGRLEWQLPLSRLFAGDVSGARLARAAQLLKESGRNSPAYAEASDLFHANTVEVLDRDVAVGRRGQILLCFRELDAVAIVDPEIPAVVWRWGPGVLDGPHHPSFLPNGHLLVFDNGRRRGWSRVFELDPATRRIVWQYRGHPPESFSSPVRGGAQALPNGNVLITESTRGRVFEVTPDGDVVWSFLNPEFRNGSRRQIYRMQRVPLDRYAAWAAAPPHATP